MNRYVTTHRQNHRQAQPNKSQRLEILGIDHLGSPPVVRVAGKKHSSTRITRTKVVTGQAGVNRRQASVDRRTRRDNSSPRYENGMPGQT